MTLTDGQLEEKIRITKEAHKNIFGEEPSESEMLEVVEAAIEKRKRAVLVDRLTNQRADRDLIKLKAFLTPKPKSTTTYAKKGK